MCVAYTCIQAQTDSTKADSLRNCEPKDIGDLFQKKNKPQKSPRKSSVLVLPNISSNPTNGFILGVGGGLGWYMGPKENTRVSTANFTAAVTSKQQLITFVKPNVFLKENKFFLQGDFRFYIYSQPTYGLGTNSPDTINLDADISFMGEGISKDSVLFPMKYNYVKIHVIANRKVIGNLYAGIGLHVDYLYSIQDEYYHPATDSTPELETPHHYYSTTNDFNLTNYMLSGVSLNIIYDSRDNQINPYKGLYGNINYRINPTFLGSDKSSTNLWLEFRTYVGLSKKMPRHLIAFWAIGNFTLTGKMPYMLLPSLGEDQRARTGRGYTNGRFRGMDIIYTEVEYRFPISQCTQILGGVVFVNATTTSNSQTGVGLFEYIRPAVGLGLRVMVNKHFRTNINIDFAIGNKSRGFYFSGQETF
jgi:outer membrane protein assembly factor BamA